MDREMFDRTWALIWDQSDPPPPEGEYQGGGFVQQDREELWELVRRVSSLCPRRILEIGCGGGGTLMMWQVLAPEVVCVDIQGLNGGRGFVSPSRLPYVEFIIGDSHDPAIVKKAEEFAPYDFLFIDGDHSTEGALADFNMYSPLVRSGGLVAFHDYNYQPVRRAIDSVGLPKEIINLSHFGIAVIEVWG